MQDSAGFSRPLPSSAALASSGVMDVRELLKVLRRRRWLIVGTVAIGLAAMALALTQLTPRYTAVASVMVDPRQTNVVDLEQVLSGLPANAETVQSEIEVLRSHDLAGRVVDELKLAENPDFNPALKEGSATGHDKPDAETRNKVIAGFLRALSVKAAGRSRVITISFESRDAEMAAKIANTLADIYLSNQLEARMAATRKASAWLSQRLEQLRVDAEAAELAVAKFKAEHRVGSGGASGAAAARLQTLEREAQASRALFATFLTRFKQTTEQEGLEQADARLISSASAPIDPSFPDVRLFLLLALAGSLGAGLALAFLVEQLDAGFRSSDQIESQLGLPTVAMVPSLKSLGIKDQEPEAYVMARPNSAFAESIRGLRTSLLLSNVDQPPRVLMLTSALPGEGKSTVALALANMAAMGGERVVVIDADLRRPRVHKALGVPNEAGLVDLLGNQITLAKALRSGGNGNAGFHYITAGTQTPHATELIRSQAMKRLVQTLAETHSLIILDTPPVLPVADTKVLAQLVDKVIYVVRWHQTHRETVVQAVKQLREVGGNFAGVVINQVDVRRHAEYSYSDSGYYYGRYRKYYTD